MFRLFELKRLADDGGAAAVQREPDGGDARSGASSARRARASRGRRRSTPQRSPRVGCRLHQADARPDDHGETRDDAQRVDRRRRRDALGAHVVRLLPHGRAEHARVHALGARRAGRHRERSTAGDQQNRRRTLRSPRARARRRRRRRPARPAPFSSNPCRWIATRPATTRRDPEQRGEIERARADHHADTPSSWLATIAGDRRRDLGASAPSAVRIPCSPSDDAEPLADAVELPPEDEAGAEARGARTAQKTGIAGPDGHTRGSLDTARRPCGRARSVPTVVRRVRPTFDLHPARRSASSSHSAQTTCSLPASVRAPVPEGLAESIVRPQMRT